MADNTAYAMNWLRQHGYSVPAAAAMVGHGMQESGLDPNATGDNGTAKGLFQWRGDRLVGLHNYAAEKGLDPNNIDTQLGYMDNELNTTEKKAGDALRAATNVRDATRAGMMYERPQGWSPANPEAGLGWGNRFSTASRLAGVPVDASAAPAAPTAMLRPSVLPAAPTPLAQAFLPPAVPVDDEFARRQAVAAAQEQERRKALLGSGGLGQLFA